MKIRHSVSLLAGWLALLVVSALAQTPTGTIEGRVLNATSGSYLNNARVVIDGTRIEAFTNESGEFRLSGVPAGPARISALFTGLQAQVATVSVVAGQVATHDFTLSRGGTAAGTSSVVKLDQFVVASSREMNAEYRFTRRLAAFTVIRNIANKPLIEERYGEITPTYARISNYQNLGSQISIGLKGEF